ncbi:hypothetical protein E4U41_001003 [Claviceps citrina]|nr:hypothetical protein E4U41_001003 [Claviceps citrina]
MTFDLRARTRYGEAIFLAGSLPELNGWSPLDAIPLDADGYTAQDPLWTATVRLPAATAFEYKYIKRMLDGRLVWLGGGNLGATSSVGCAGGGKVSDTWR